MIRTDPAGTVVTLIREISEVGDRIMVVLRPADGSVAATVDRGYPVTRGPLVMIEGSDSGAVLLPGAPEPVEIAALGPGFRNDSAVTTSRAAIGACRQDGAATGTWQLQIQSVDPINDPVPIGDLSGRAEQMIVAPGAVVSVVSTGGQIHNHAFR